MADYSAVHAGALAKVRDKGAPVTFRKRTAGEYDPLTDETQPPTEELVAGYAVEIPGELEEYDAYNLSPSKTIMLFFIPTVFGQLPAIGATVGWAGVTHTVEAIIPLRPAGVPVGGKVMVA